MIHPDLQYCPQWGDEYRAEISHCAACAVVLMSGRQRLQQEEERRAVMENRYVAIKEGEELVVVTLFGEEVEGVSQECDREQQWCSYAVVIYGWDKNKKNF